MYLRAPQNALIFHSQASGQMDTATFCRSCQGRLCIGQLLSASQMALTWQESKEHDLKWIFMCAAPNTRAAVPNPSPSPATWHTPASPSQLTLHK